MSGTCNQLCRVKGSFGTRGKCDGEIRADPPCLGQSWVAREAQGERTGRRERAKKRMGNVAWKVLGSASEWERIVCVGEKEKNIRWKSKM